MGLDAGHANGYALSMKAFGLYSFVIVLALLFAAAQPGDGMPEVHAALDMAGPPGFQPACNSMGCLAGWQAAHERGFSHEDECRLLSSERDEVAGCLAFVHAEPQERLGSIRP